MSLIHHHLCLNLLNAIFTFKLLWFTHQTGAIANSLNFSSHGPHFKLLLQHDLS